MTACNEREASLLALLTRHAGRANAISAPEIAAHLGCSERKARALVQHLRLDHFACIAATPADGYFLAIEPSELEHTLASLGSRIAELLKLKDALRHGAELRWGQQEMFTPGRTT